MMQLVRVDEVAPTPWKNGGGVARDLLCWPSVEDWQLRISVADIEADGPFSSYPGIDRWFGLLSGRGVRLQWPQAVRHMHPGHALLHFDGAMAPECRLDDGPARAFNVMARRGALRVRIEAAVPGSQAPEGFAQAALFTREAAVLHRAAPLQLPAWSLVWGQRTHASLQASDGVHAWWVAFEEAAR